MKIRDRVLVGDISVLADYPESQLEEELDKFGWNAYHYLAQGRKTEVLSHVGAYKLRNKSGETAIDILIKNSEIDLDVLTKFFPWYMVIEGDSIEESLKKIRETSSAEKFILSILD